MTNMRRDILGVLLVAGSLVFPMSGFIQWPTFMYWLNGVTLGIGFADLIVQWRSKDNNDNNTIEITY